MTMFAQGPKRGALAVGLVALTAMLVAGCSTGFLQPPPPATTQGRETQSLYEIVFAVAVIVFVLVEGLILFAAVRYRRRKGDESLPPQVHGNNVLEVIWTAIPMVVVAALFFLSWQTLNSVDAVSATPQLKISVTGFQWQWQFQYPSEGVTVVGLPGQAPEMVVPVGETVQLDLQSRDVIHGFYVPAYRIKEDVVPGRENYLWFQPDTEGTFEVMCSSYCGERHSYMRANLRVMPGKEFRKWYGAKTGRRAALGARGIMDDAGCLVCHSLDGSPAPGPTFKGLWGRRETVVTDGTERAVTVDEAYVRKSIREPAADLVKGYRTIMPAEPLTGEELGIIVRYLKALR